MKKNSVFILFLFFLVYISKAQLLPKSAVKVSEAPAEVKQSDDSDDESWRFGLRATPQLCWFANPDKNIKPNGKFFGFGFGLQMERRFSGTVGLVTGIGGDFEGGKYSSTFDTANSYSSRYWLNAEGELVQPEDGKNVSTYRTQGNVEYVLHERTINTTYVTIPAILKLSTNELGGFKYFGMFGGEFGIRIKTQAKDTYYSSTQFNAAGVPSDAGITSLSKININKDAPLIPIRIGLNVGVGAEYRLSGKTSFMFSANFFHSFINVLKPVSAYNVSSVTGGDDYTFVKQAILMNAVRLNLGILF